MDATKKYFLALIGAVLLTAFIILGIKSNEAYQKCMIREKNEHFCSVLNK